MDALEKALGKQAFLLLDEQLGKKWVVIFWDIYFLLKGGEELPLQLKPHAGAPIFCTHFPLDLGPNREPEFQDDFEQVKSIFWVCR